MIYLFSKLKELFSDIIIKTIRYNSLHHNNNIIIEHKSI